MEKIIQKLVRKYKTNCPFELSRYLNIKILYADLGETKRGLYYRVLRRRYIVLHENLTEEWARFVTAHELGHDRLHKGLSVYFVEETSSLLNPGKLERQANSFAVNLLTTCDRLQESETIESFYTRNGVPLEMIDRVNFDRGLIACEQKSSYTI